MPDASSMTHVFDLRDFLAYAPEEWLDGDSKVLVVAYKVFEVPAARIPAPKVISLSDVVGVLIHARLSYVSPTAGGLEAAGDGWQFRVHVGEPQEAPEGGYIVLMTRTGEESREEVAANERIGVAAGLLGAFQGRNIVYERLAEIVLSDTETVFYSPIMENPGALGAPNLGDEYLKLIENADQALAALPERDRNRVRLALRWFDMAVHDFGTDALVKYWFALETLAMPDTTNIRPLEQTLADSYHLTLEQARDRFKMGRLYGRRSRIVHEGDLTPVHGDLLVYLQALFMDILRHLLGITPAHRAGRLVDQSHVSLDQVL